MAYSKKTTHTEEGLANLIEQFKGKANLETLIEIYLSQIQDVENAACDILEKTDQLLPDEELFVWSGAFPYPATSHAELIKYLGMDGSVSPDVSGGTHLWELETTSQEPDIGSLANGTDFDFGIVANGVTTVTDANYKLGLENVTQHDTSLSSRMQLQDNGFQKIPSVKDGTVSFMVGGIAQIDSIIGAETFANMVNQFRQGGNGWTVTARNAGSGGWDVGYFKFSISQNNWANTQTCRTVINDGQPQAGVNFGEPFAFMCGLDVAAGHLFIMISNSVAMTTTTWTDIGAFDSLERALRIGDADWFGVNDSFHGIMAQLFSIEWSSAVDAGLSMANMRNFLKGCDGLLP